MGSAPSNPTLSVVRLRYEYLINPLGIDELRPRLSWELSSARRGAAQSAYRIAVATSAAALAGGEADAWDSGRVESNQTIHIEYAGRALKSRERLHWRVEVWDEAGALNVSEPAFWSMGLLEPGDWRAQWIAADPEIIARDPEATQPTMTELGTPGLFRREFEIPGAIKSATLYATARGLFEARIGSAHIGAARSGGRRVGADVFAPEWTDYDKRIQYRAYDVTEMIAPGRNTIAATLGDGWWSGYVGWQETRARYGSLENSLCMQLEIELENGETIVVATGPDWRCITGPILFSDFMMGEAYDARREREGWDAADFDDANWLPARAVAAPDAPLVAQRSEPVRVMERITPALVGEIEPGRFLFNLGQNIAGWVRIEGEAHAGTRIQIRHGEQRNPDGGLHVENLRRAKATDVYICKGGAFAHEPHFTFHGFQYFEVTGLATLNDITFMACVVRSATPEAGHFECSHAGVNRLWLNGLWSQRGNFISIPTDCPQRDERLGWTGDAQVFSRTATCNMDVAAFFTKWMNDVDDAQTPEGIYPDTAPRLREDANFMGLGNLGGAAGWADAGVIIPWTMWRVYGDLRAVARHWDAMVKWLDWIERNNPDGLRLNALANNYGDWLCIPSDTSFGTHSPMKNLLATAYWADDAVKMAAMARALGRDDDARRFDAMFARVRDAFQKEWLRGEGELAVETQTAYLLALAFNLLPEDQRARAAERLVENIRNLDWHLSTGFIGISHLNPQLTLAGYPDVAWRLLLQESYPSWLYPVKHGATTIWERWDAYTEENGFMDPHLNSFNHYSFGSIGEWLFRFVAGIELDAEANGFGRFVLRPHPGGGLDFAHAVYRGMHGTIMSHWKRSERDRNLLEWTVRIPANTTARIYVPCEPSLQAANFGDPLESTEGITVIGRQGRALVCEAVSGVYCFETVFSEEDGAATLDPYFDIKPTEA